MLFNIIMILLIIIGVGLIIFACFTKKGKKNTPSDYFEANASVQLVKQAIDDADNAIEQLNSLSSNIFKEFEEKYQELLFLYQMIDDMKEKSNAVDIKADYRQKADFEKSEKSITKEKNITPIKNPKYDKIKSMQDQGLSISEISKALNIGQGEIKLILELGKAR